MDIFSTNFRSFRKYRPITLEEISKLDNLFSAYIKVKKKNKGPGINNLSLKDISSYEIHFLSKLSKILLSKTYIPKVVKLVRIKKSNGKIREIGVLCLEDKIIQNAILNILSPPFEDIFLQSSFAYRKELSYLDAVKNVENLLKNGYTYILDLDIEKFFDSIDHNILQNILYLNIQDKKLQTLLNRYLLQRVYDNGNIFKLQRGIIQGAPLSPLYSNIYLHKLDVFLNNSYCKMIRYADDFVILLKDPKHIKDILVKVENFLDTYRLNLNYDKCKIINFNKVKKLEFLGQIIYKSW